METTSNTEKRRENNLSLERRNVGGPPGTRREEPATNPVLGRGDLGRAPTPAGQATQPNPTPSARSASSTRPTEEEVRHRAYEIYQARGGEPGREAEDWIQAERELRNRKKLF